MPPTSCAKPFADAVPRGTIDSWVTTDDYFQQALREGRTGAVRFRVDVSVTGRVGAVEVLESGDPLLAEATARLLTRRGRFVSAMRKCQPVLSEYEGMPNRRIPE